MDRPPSDARHLYARLDQENDGIPMGDMVSSPVPMAINVVTNGWNCHACTFTNVRMDAAACEMCQAPRYAQPAMPVSPLPVAVPVMNGRAHVVSQPLMYPSIGSPNHAGAPLIAVATPVVTATPVVAPPAMAVILPVAPVAGDLVLVTPPVPTKEQFDYTMKTRRVHFSSMKYLKESWSFFKVNWCALSLPTIIVGIIALVIVVVLLATISPNQWQYDMDDGNNGNGNGNGYAHGYANLLNMLPNHNGNTGRDGNGHDGHDGRDRDGTTGGDDWNAWDDERPFGDCNVWMLIAIGVPITMIGYWFKSAAYAAVFQAIRTNSKFQWCNFCRALGTDKKHAFWMSLVMTLITGVAMITPMGGMLIPFFLSLVVPLHREHQWMGMWQAIKYSASITARYCCSIIGFIIILVLLAVASMIVPFAIIVALPVIAIAHVYMYHHVIGINGAPVLVSQQAPSLNHGAVAANPLLHVGQDAN